MKDSRESNPMRYIWKLDSSCSDRSIYSSSYTLQSDQQQLSKLSFTGRRNVNAPEADCEYGQKNIHFAQKSALSFKVVVSDSDTGEQLALLTPSKIQSKAEIELPIGTKYYATKKGILHVKLEISDDIGRKLCELHKISLESTDFESSTSEILHSDPDFVFLSILSFYLHECIGSNG